MSERFLEILARCHKELNRPVLICQFGKYGDPHLIMRLEWIHTMLGAPSKRGIVERTSLPLEKMNAPQRFLEDMLEEMLETAKSLSKVRITGQLEGS